MYIIYSIYRISVIIYCMYGAPPKCHSLPLPIIVILLHASSAWQLASNTRHTHKYLHIITMETACTWTQTHTHTHTHNTTSPYPLSNKSLTMSLCELSMALIIGVPPLKDCLSMIAPEFSSNLTTASYDDKQE